MLPLNRCNCGLRLQDVKAFLIGMFLVFVIEIIIDTSRYSSDCSINGRDNLRPQPSYFGSVDLSYAKNLASTIHIYCFILTEPSQFKSQYHVQNTWVRRCTRYGFVTHGDDKLLRILDAKHNVPTYKRRSWNTMRTTLRALYEQKDKQSFYLKADFDNYFVLENVRYMLKQEDPNEPFILGHVHNPGPFGDKLSGSAGYVLSRKALELIVSEGLERHTECGEVDRNEDEQISLCAESVGVEVRDSLDFLGKSRFSNVSISELLGPYANNTPRWYPEESDYTLPNYDLHKLPASPLLVSFAGIDGTMMYVLEYLLYHLRPTGITHKWLYQTTN